LWPEIEIVVQPWACEAVSTNPDNALHRAILGYLFELHRTPTGRHGRETVVREMVGVVRKRTGATLENVLASLVDLVRGGCVHERRQLLVLPGGGSAELELYSIARRGAQRIDADLDVTSPIPAQDATVVDQRHLTTVFLDNDDRVSATQNDLSATLATLARIIELDRELSEPARRDALGDLETVRAQISKTNPDHRIISIAWKGVRMAATTREAAMLFRQASVLLGQR